MRASPMKIYWGEIDREEEVRESRDALRKSLFLGKDKEKEEVIQREEYVMNEPDKLQTNQQISALLQDLQKVEVSSK